MQMPEKTMAQVEGNKFDKQKAYVPQPEGIFVSQSLSQDAEDCN